MALISIKRNVDLQPGLNAPAVFNCSQSDKGTTIMLGLMNGGNDYTVPSGVTITIRGSRSNGAVFTPTSATFSGSTVSFTLTEEMTDTAGPTLCEAVLEQGNNVLGTANFIINVEGSPMGADVPPVFTDAAWTWMLGKLTTETVPALGDDVISSIQGKVDKSQGSTNAKKFLRVNTSGNVSLASTDKTLLVADQIADAKETGDQIRALDAEIDGVATTLGGSISTLNGITTDLQSSKLNKNQGTSNAGKTMVVDSSGNIVPGDVPITIDDTLSIADAAADAKAAGDAIALKANASTIAPEFSDQNTYTAGSYVYKNGVLYKFTSDHSGAWTGSDAETVTVGGEVSFISDEVNKGLIEKATLSHDRVANGYLNVNGVYSSNTAYRTYEYYIQPGAYNSITATGANMGASSPKSIAFITFIDSAFVKTVGATIPSTDSSIHTETISIPKNTTTIQVCVSKNYVDTYGAPVVILGYVASVSERAPKNQTIIGGIKKATFLSNKYINPNNYLPSSTASTGWDLYKIDVSECDALRIRTYIKSGSDGAPLYTVVNSDFEDVTSTNQTSENIVSHDSIHAGTNDMVEMYVNIPTGGKTVLVACATAQNSNFEIVAYHYGYFPNIAYINDLQEIKTKVNVYGAYKLSPYYKDVRWGCPSFAEHYHSVDDGTPLFTNATTAAQYFAMFNALVGDYTGYAESHEMGLASDGVTMMYYYTFTPKAISDTNTYKRPKIIISSGQHGFEKTANFGVYWFCKNLLEDWQSSDFLAYVRNHVQLIVMPCLNPYGFDNDTYTNANGVNLNRNWDTSAWSKGTPGTVTYGGEAPLDQPETQYASAVILGNLDAFWLCDYHNNGQVAPDYASSYLWHSFAIITHKDAYFEKAFADAAKWHIDDTTGYLYIDYPNICNYEISGHITDNNAPSGQGLITAYAREHNIMAATMEGAAAFIGSGSRYSSSIHHMNADLLGNWIRCLLACYSHCAE